MKLLMLGKGQEGYGNFHTAKRICDAITQVRPDFDCRYLSIPTTLDPILKERPQLVIGIHLRRCSLLSELADSLPYLLVCGGTDINEDIHRETFLRQMRTAVRGARGIVVFSAANERQLIEYFGQEIREARVKVWTIPQAVIVSPPSRDVDVYTTLGLPPSTPYFLVVGRIRKVKDPCFIIRPFCEWMKTRQGAPYRLIYLGTMETLPGEQCEGFLDELQCHSDAVKHKATVSAEDCHQAMRHAEALINCSLSEGQPLSVLEAMAVGIPVIVRDIPGNTDLVEHLKTGLVFSDAESFSHCLSLIADQPQLRADLLSNGRTFVADRHGDVAKEGRGYVDAILHALTASDNSNSGDGL